MDKKHLLVDYSEFVKGIIEENNKSDNANFITLLKNQEKVPDNFINSKIQKFNALEKKIKKEEAERYISTNSRTEFNKAQYKGNSVFQNIYDNLVSIKILSGQTIDCAAICKPLVKK